MGHALDGKLRPAAIDSAMARQVAEVSSVEKEEIMEQSPKKPQGTTSRRSFLLTGAAVGAGAAGSGLLAKGVPAFAETGSAGLTPGDAAILRFLAAAEILETDVWQQYNELGASKTAKSQAGAGVRTTPLPWKCWMRTCPSTGVDPLLLTP